MTSEKSPGVNRAPRSGIGACARWISVMAQASDHVEVRQNDLPDEQRRLARTVACSGEKHLVAPQSPLCQEPFDACPIQSFLFPQLQRPFHAVSVKGIYPRQRCLASRACLDSLRSVLKEPAVELGLSETIVQTCRQRVYEKLRVRSPAEGVPRPL